MCTGTLVPVRLMAFGTAAGATAHRLGQTWRIALAPEGVYQKSPAKNSDGYDCANGTGVCVPDRYGVKADPPMWPRTLLPDERRLLDVLLSRPFEGRDELRAQAAAVQVTGSGPYSGSKACAT